MLKNILYCYLLIPKQKVNLKIYIRAGSFVKKVPWYTKQERKENVTSVEVVGFWKYEPVFPHCFTFHNYATICHTEIKKKKSQGSEQGNLKWIKQKTTSVNLYVGTHTDTCLLLGSIGWKSPEAMNLPSIQILFPKLLFSTKWLFWRNADSTAGSGKVQNLLKTSGSREQCNVPRMLRTCHKDQRGSCPIRDYLSNKINGSRL